MSTAPEIARLAACGVVPVVVIDEVEIAVPLAQALLAGGIDVIEITLRRPAAMAALEKVARELPEILPVAGTVVTPQQAAEVQNAGARAVVSPGFTESVDEAMRKTGLPWLPGVATASDCMRAVSAGRLHCKFFPAEQAGGVPGLKALSGPFPQMKFCPTGGVSLANLGNYLALPQVLCVGGSWLVPADAVKNRDWAQVTKLAREAREKVAELRG
ncbi:MAG: bifunctional 4-hydroxy-2-oxoglutarate aldolase/2-dehydro-3-deoxy-phosphogluconate aldolase [Bosea sp.]|uniref:bifunctional 4-hydroxy-2-oxoglutarate aldolase/2-dehydro-3-deoxy-phosphogluconate aldolase n=1 Tax=Bosea sp. (in: a-proteobacteria) TaxID=1871050 RepID=UPI001AD2B0F5|nr:bifunctional 4-hydroxy-2-oxoglutarate aldolase/2-dehydro-3-deoxy-phosphogluconate aldolase [Bosea sp. (in: a-proteobacteria)]MBN9467466.1 bifunctional 4-hydroxy-2-oxoglutarate aldolase/2-dehydro-3-deoxy-phosphogluconate aldolase [Bosea sp. (in: a-proteobacteria)]